MEEYLRSDLARGASGSPGCGGGGTWEEIIKGAAEGSEEEEEEKMKKKKKKKKKKKMMMMKKKKDPLGCGEDGGRGAAGEEKIMGAADGRKQEEMKKKKKKSKKKKKQEDRTPSPVSGSDGTARSRTAEKRTKITSTSGDLSEIARGVDEEYEKIVQLINLLYEGPIEGIDWDEDTIDKEIHHYRNQLKPAPLHRNFQVFYEEPQLKELNERLALYRIRALKEELRNLEDAELRRRYPSLEDEGYFESHEDSFKWYFDKSYCHYAWLQDYQRLMLRNNGEYEDWEYYRETCSTPESDQQFVQFWEELKHKIKWVVHGMDASTLVWLRLESVAYYHALKIATRFPKIPKSLVFSGYSDYIWDVRQEKTFVQSYIDLFYAIWKRVTEDKMDFKEALRQVYVEDKYCPMFRSDMKAELDRLDGKVSGSPGHVRSMYKTYVAKIEGGVTKGMFHYLMKPVVRNLIIGRKVYIDYAQEKLDIAKQIGVIKP